MRRPISSGLPPATVYGKHVGETILVIGNSDSLTGMDLDQFDFFTTIGLNRILRIYEPIYTMMVDQSVVRDEYERMPDAQTTFLIYPGAMSSKIRALYNGPWVSTGTMTSQCDPTAKTGPIHICKVGNSAYEAVQIAYRMGASRIALAGVDMYWPPGKDSHFFGDGNKAGCALRKPDAITKDFGELKKMFKSLDVDMFSISPWKTHFRDVMGYVPLDQL